MTKLKKFYNRLEQLRKPESSDPYEDRITHCKLLHNHNGRVHTFEVRGWSKLEKDETGEEVLRVAVVNWTLCAGTALIYFKEHMVDTYLIEEY